MTVPEMRHSSRASRSPIVLVAACSLMALGGCKVGPNYVTPAEQMPAGFHPATTQPDGNGHAEAPPAELDRWWQSLNDPQLASLIDRAVQSNLDLGIAVARVQEARYQRMGIAAGLWPFLDFASGGPGRPPLYGHVSGTLERASTRTKPGGSMQLRQEVGGGGPPSLYVVPPGRHPVSVLLNPGSATTPPSANIRPTFLAPDGKQTVVGRDQFTYESGFDAIWVLDVFGGIRRAIEAADADVEAAAEARNDILVILLGDVGRAYIELRGFQWRLDIARQNIQTQRRTVDLVHTRFRNGLTNNLDVAQAERQLASTESRVPVLEASVAQSEHLLSLLLGLTPEALHEELNKPMPLPISPPEVPVGLPSELLRRRPDIRRSERELAAETARIGVAVADLFPQFTLTGYFGAQTSDIRKIFEGDSLAWSAGPGIRWPIFQGGQIVARIYFQQARAGERLLNYRRTILTALREVSDALAQYDGQRGQSSKLNESVEASKRAVKYAEERYEKGVTDFINVLDAQRSLYDLEDQYAVSNQEMITQLVLIYKALGGGWQEYQDQMASAATQPAEPMNILRLMAPH